MKLRLIDYSQLVPKKPASAKTWFISYAQGDESFYRNQNHQIYASLESGVDVFINYRLKHLDLQFTSKHPLFFFLPTRGAGFWMWKPFVIKKTLEMMDKGDLLIYSDVGLSLKKYANDIIENMISDQEIVAFEAAKFGPYVKRDAYTYFGLDPEELKFKSMPQAGFQVIRKTANTVEFIDKWLAACEVEHLIDDSPSVEENLPDFKDHRHDQALLGLVAEKHNGTIKFRMENHVNSADFIDYHGNFRAGSLYIADNSDKAWDFANKPIQAEFCFKRSIASKQFEFLDPAIKNNLCPIENPPYYFEFTDYSIQRKLITNNLGPSKKVWLISYADRHETHFQNQQYLAYSAVNKGIDALCNYNKLDLDRDFVTKHAALLYSNTRGAGYWIWKPYIILRTLEKLKDGDVLIYLDSGISIKKSLVKIIDKTEEYDLIVTNSYSNKIGEYTKGDAIDFFFDNRENIANKILIQGGVLLIKNNSVTRSFIEKWLKLCEDHHLLTDEESAAPNESNYHEHRHDQSLLSLLVYNQTLAPKILIHEPSLGDALDYHHRMPGNKMSLMFKNKDGDSAAGIRSYEDSEYYYCLQHPGGDLDGKYTLQPQQLCDKSEL